MDPWVAANWTYLRGETARVTGALERAAAGQPPMLAAPTPIPAELVLRAPAIMCLARALELSPFDRELVLACAAAELEPDFPKRTRFTRPLLALALNAFANADPA